MRYSLFFLVGCLCAIFQVQAQTSSQNYIVSRTWKHTSGSANDVSKVQIKVQYLDGLGRSSQNVSVGESPSGADLVEHFEYDPAGRQSRIYLSYTVASGNGNFQSGAVSSQSTFYSTNVPGLKSDDLGRPYMESFYEPSPLNRPSGNRAPGNKSVAESQSYGVNIASEVKRYEYSSNVDITMTISSSGDYAANTLFKTQTSDEQGNIVFEFTDLQNRLICRKVNISETETLETYYVYDDFSLLRAVLQPQYQEGSDVSEVKNNNFAFLYDYDLRGRIKRKKVPGAGVANMVYDNSDRMVLSQDANQLSRGTWFFTKYDAFDRPIATGEFLSSTSAPDWQTLIDAASSFHETKLTTGIHYTLDQTVPTTVTEDDCYSITYYDDYSFPKTGLDYTATYYPSSVLSNTTKPTGQKTRINPLPGASGAWLTSVTYYDSEYRPVQITKDLYDLGTNAIERVSIKYKHDLASVVEEEKTEQVVDGSTISHLEIYTLDHADRTLSVKEKIVYGGITKESTTIAQRYNALGSLNQKWFHSENGANFRRRTDYTHNIRGWQTDGKSVYLKQAGYGDSTLYAFGLEYAYGGNYSNGNISKMEWMHKGQTAFTNGLSFTYDKANRLTASSGLSGYTNIENGISYDKNGNIATLVRAGSVVDNLTYSYSGNQLSAINDASGNNSGIKAGSSSYAYDAMGNMTSDGTRGAVITYNHLNLPKSVTLGGKTLTYNYDASGIKHRYSADTLTINYAGIFEYRFNGTTNSLYRVATSDGQAVYRGGALKFEYYLQDHLGNVRVVFDEKGKIIQSNDYYPFGLSIDRNGQTKAAHSGINRYLYNGKELQAGTEYVDYGARMYMPEIGRWGVVDPLADSSRRFSPYAYTFDNPLRFIDRDGRQGNALANWLQFILDYFGFFKQPKTQEEAQTYTNRREKLDDLNDHLEEAQEEMRDAAGWVPFLGAASDISYGAIKKDNTTVVIGIAGIIVDLIPGGRGAKGFSAVSTAVRSALADRIGKRGFTEVGYQFQKHFGRGGAWRNAVKEGTTLNPKTFNQLGYEAFKEIWKAPGSFQKVNGFIEKRLPDGRGIRLQENWQFKGFLD